MTSPSYQEEGNLSISSSFCFSFSRSKEARAEHKLSVQGLFSHSYLKLFLQISERFNRFQHKTIMALEFSRWHRMTEVGIWVDNKFPWTFLLQGCRHVPQPHALTSGYCREEDKVLWASTSSFLCLQCHKIQDGLQASPDQETKLTLVSLSLSRELQVWPFNQFL